MKTLNTKVNRLLGSLALELKDLPDAKISHIDAIINDEHDGYDFNFINAVDFYHRLVE